jgi:hypothetical protein
VLASYHELGVTPAEMMFVIHVWQYWWSARCPYPSLTHIAENMGITQRQARRYSQSLQDKGLLVIRERHDSELGQLTNEYDFSLLIQAVMGRTHMSGG